mmetsp:Transcript_20879/g.42564  ORF Transcript_20879/g.42564 Transcript_20879/m.42564 type:complete len:231 (-) Transcript_20879:394-1086(-)
MFLVHSIHYIHQPSNSEIHRKHHALIPHGLGSKRLTHIRIRHTRIKRQRPSPLPSQLVSRRPHSLIQRSFRDPICIPRQSACIISHGRHAGRKINDHALLRPRLAKIGIPPLPGFHQRSQSLRQHDWTHGINSQLMLKPLMIDLRQIHLRPRSRLLIPEDTRHIEQPIDSSILLFQIFRNMLDLIHLGHVQPRHFHPDPLISLQPIQKRIQGGGTPRAQHAGDDASARAR